MKSYKEVAKKYTAKEIAESLVFAATTDKNKRASELSELRSVRKKITENQTSGDKASSRLLQLKFLIEDYIRDSSKPDSIKSF
jgi:hypothetical protein